MKWIKQALLLIATVLTVTAYGQPTIHAGVDVTFSGDYHVYETVSNYNGYGGVIFTYGSRLVLDPQRGNNEYFYQDDYYAWTFNDENQPVDRKSSVVVWNWIDFPIPSGYQVPGAEWDTLVLSTVANSKYTKSIPASGITPLQSGDVWLDWNQDGTLRITWSATEPVNFSKYLSDGSRNRHQTR